ncbi:MAG TPA: hypothetical protein VD926_04065 [Acidimicrobiales bacterium]|nr:hypothetical protein [Acidimicrobiales bacterium]
MRASPEAQETGQTDTETTVTETRTETRSAKAAPEARYAVIRRRTRNIGYGSTAAVRQVWNADCTASWHKVETVDRPAFKGLTPRTALAEYQSDRRIFGTSYWDCSFFVGRDRIFRALGYESVEEALWALVNGEIDRLTVELED